MAQTDGTIRAEILDTKDDRIRSAQIVINAPAAEIFDVLVQPRRHSEFDGSGSVQAVIKSPERVGHGDRFTMRMHLGFGYWVTNTVVDFEPDRRIAWAHLLGNVWSYELIPQADESTLVRETNDLRAAGWRANLSPTTRNPDGMRRSIAKSLVQLKALVESGD